MNGKSIRKTIAGSGIGRIVQPAYVQVSQRVRLARNVIYDARRFLRWSFTVRRPLTQDQMRASLVMVYHSLEKGLAFSNPRPKFGREKADRLISLLRQYADRFGCDHYLSTSVNVLQAYHDFNVATGHIYEPAMKAIEQLKSNFPEIGTIETGGTRQITRDAISAATGFDFGVFCETRHSVRHFAQREIEQETIESIIRWAQKTPSVCNRQSCRVHVFTDTESKKLALSHQNGNRGFGHEAGAVFIVTSDLQHFHNPSERFQCWIDGGMFAMSLLYAIHSLQMGACALNWSATYERDIAMRRAVGIPDNEIVIMMIALGHLPDDLKVAQSTRKNLDEVIRWH